MLAPSPIDDRADVGAEHGAVPDARALLDGHVADQGRGRGDEGVGVDGGALALELVQRHGDIPHPRRHRTRTGTDADDAPTASASPSLARRRSAAKVQRDVPVRRPASAVASVQVCPPWCSRSSTSSLGSVFSCVHPHPGSHSLVSWQSSKKKVPVTLSPPSGPAPGAHRPATARRRTPLPGRSTRARSTGRRRRRGRPGSRGACRRDVRRTPLVPSAAAPRAGRPVSTTQPQQHQPRPKLAEATATNSRPRAPAPKTADMMATVCSSRSSWVRMRPSSAARLTRAEMPNTPDRDPGRSTGGGGGI